MSGTYWNEMPSAADTALMLARSMEVLETEGNSKSGLAACCAGATTLWSGYTKEPSGKSEKRDFSCSRGQRAASNCSRMAARVNPCEAYFSILRSTIEDLTLRCSSCGVSALTCCSLPRAFLVNSVRYPWDVSFGIPFVE